MGRVVYDIETYPNCFTACFSPLDSDGGYVFEISDRRDDSAALLRYLETLRLMVGFNNMGFDWPILQYLREMPNAKAPEIYEFAMRIIGCEDRFAFIIWNPVIAQVDLYRIHHFDNRAKATSLKKLQFNMRSNLVQDLPFPVGTFLSFPEIDVLLKYNVHDVLETKTFWFKSQDKIKLREAIEPLWMNASDTKLGRNYFIRELENAGVQTHTRPEDGGRKQPIVTQYPDGVTLGKIIFPYLWFQDAQIQQALEVFKTVKVVDTIAPDGTLSRCANLPTGADGLPVVFKEYKFTLDGVEITMGLGGLHGSIERKLVEGCGIILDLDVTSFYPSISIRNRVFPAHLGLKFCEVYQKLLERRLQTAKGTPENGAIKLALNSVFGSAGSPYTCFYDLAFMLGITINGQFLILSLAEILLRVPGVRLIQVNTDGITIVVPEDKADEVHELYMAWQAATQLPLEANRYSRLWIRDVNNYIAEYTNGKRKRKGCYQAERDWHQNHSMPVVRMAAEASMCDGIPIEQYLREHKDPWDFMMRLDLTKTSRLVLDDGRELLGVVRYYVSPTGHSGTKVMPKTKTKIHGKGHAEAVGKRGEWVCTACKKVFKRKEDWANHADKEHSSKIAIAQEYSGEPINYDMRYYKGEAQKLIINERFIP
jgi:hypothetical protein